MGRGQQTRAWKWVSINLPDGHLKFEGAGRGRVGQAGTRAGQADEGRHRTSGEDV